MSKHTPGPWYVVNHDSFSEFTAISTKPEISGNSKIDLENEVLGTSEWLRAKPEDLGLMALAPELLEACQKVAKDGVVPSTMDMIYGVLDKAGRKSKNEE